MSDEQLGVSKEEQEVLKLFSELFKNGHTWGDLKTLLSRAWRDWKDSHPRIKRIQTPRADILVISKDGKMDARFLTKVIDVPFESLSPRAKKLYLEAIKELRMEDTI